MKVTVVLEQRFLLAADGSVWTSDAAAGSRWLRYLEIFDEVQIVARAQSVAVPPVSGGRIDGKGVTLAPVPMYLGSRQFLARAARVRSAIRQALADSDAVMLVVPGTLGNIAFPILRRSRRPFGVEVVGDPAGVFGAGGAGGALRVVLKSWFVRSLKRQCSHAEVAIYATQRTLQQHYPPAPRAFTTFSSSVHLTSEATAAVLPPVRDQGPYRIVTVGSMEQLYKGVDTLLLAVKQCIDTGLALSLDVVGDGRFRPQLEALALETGVSDAVTFVGQLPGPAAVRQLIAGSDLFVLASTTEGLPRALVEAMALGIPCIASSVGGIPELLPVEDLFSASAPEALASRMSQVLRDPSRRRAMSLRNLTKAGEFQESELAPRRLRAYSELAERTLRERCQSL